MEFSTCRNNFRHDGVVENICRRYFCWSWHELLFPTICNMPISHFDMTFRHDVAERLNLRRPSSNLTSGLSRRSFCAIARRNPFIRSKVIHLTDRQTDRQTAVIHKPSWVGLKRDEISSQSDNSFGLNVGHDIFLELMYPASLSSLLLL